MNAKKKHGIKHFSWHFWFLLILTALGAACGFAINEYRGLLIIGALVYLSPLFLSFTHIAIPKDIMIKFYKKAF